MTVLAIIDNVSERVENIIKADHDVTANYPGKTVINVDALSPRPAAGWIYSGGQFSVDLAARKRALKQIVNAIRQEKRELGLTYRTKTFQIDAESVQNVLMTATLVIGGRLSGDITWRTADNTDLVLTPVQFARLLDLVQDYIKQLLSHSHALKDSIDAATSEGELDAIDLYGGWPGNDSGEMA